MADGIDQISEVVQHVVDEVFAAGFLQAEHREIGVPVVALAEASAGHDIRLGQWNERAYCGTVPGVLLRVNSGQSQSICSRKL